MKILVFLLAVVCVRAETLDRIAVTVGRHVISEHDILQDIRVSAFIDGKAPVFGPQQKRKAAERLVDQYLVLEDAAATRVPPPPASDLAALLTPIKARYASDQAYRDALASAQISEAELSDQVLSGLRMLRYTDLRFRPEVQISEEALRAYYDKLAPPQTFEASRGDIEKLLTNQQTMQALDRWLEMSRGETAIIYREGAFE
ncbi:MAG: hypothetical protein M3O20_10665 [Acidobacteriota bacterium]|nr:hypothetical protein [Acidobacteriota bacterium]